MFDTLITLAFFVALFFLIHKMHTGMGCGGHAHEEHSQRSSRKKEKREEDYEEVHHH